MTSLNALCGLCRFLFPSDVPSPDGPSGDTSTSCMRPDLSFLCARRFFLLSLRGDWASACHAECLFIPQFAHWSVHVRERGGWRAHIGAHTLTHAH